MLILKNNSAKERVNNKLRDLGLAEVADDSFGDNALSDHVCTDVSLMDGQSADLLNLVGCHPVNLVKDEASLQQRIKTMTPSQMDAYKVMTNSSQQRLLFVTDPGCTGKSFLIHSVVAQLTLNEGKFVEMLATSGSAAYLLGGKTIHRFFRLGVKLETYLEWGTVDCNMVSNTDVLIIDEYSMTSASLWKGCMRCVVASQFLLELGLVQYLLRKKNQLDR